MLFVARLGTDTADCLFFARSFSQLPFSTLNVCVRVCAKLSMRLLVSVDIKLNVLVCTFNGHLSLTEMHRPSIAYDIFLSSFSFSRQIFDFVNAHYLKLNRIFNLDFDENFLYFFADKFDAIMNWKIVSAPNLNLASILLFILSMFSK